MKLILAILTGSGMVVLGATPLNAQDQPKREGTRFDISLFNRLDTNGDGVVTDEEIPEARREVVQRLFKRMDTNGDNRITREEFDVAVARLRPNRESPKRRLDPGKKAAGPAQGEGRPQTPERAGQPGQSPLPGRPLSGNAGPNLFSALDTNRDAKLSREELARAVELLMRYDRDGDGALTPEELAGGIRDARSNPPALPGSGEADFVGNMIRRADTDKDGKLSRDEVPELMRARFDTIDANKDGFIDRDELKQAGERMRQDRRARGLPSEPSERPGGPEGLGANRERVANFLREHDRDADGRLTLEEFGGDRREQFQRLDANGDGFLSPPELVRGLAPSNDRLEPRK